MGWAAALAGMVLYAVASVSQGFAASRASGSAVLRHPAYVLGLVCDALAWVASLVALTRLPIFVVQSLLAGSLAVTVLLGTLVLHVRPLRRDWWAIGVVTAGLALVSLSSGAESTAPPPSWYPLAVVVLALGAAALAGALYPRGSSLPLAAVAGLGFSGLALGARAVHVPEGVGAWASVVEVVRQPAAWALLLAGVVGAVIYARALERGPLGPATAVMWVVEVVLPGAVGVAVLGDAVRAGWGLAALLGVVAAVTGCALLALSPAQEAVGG